MMSLVEGLTPFLTYRPENDFLKNLGVVLLSHCGNAGLPTDPISINNQMYPEL